MKRQWILLVALFMTSITAWSESGTCGENLMWDLTDGTLTISGTGAMTDYSSFGSRSPWRNNSSSITTVIIKDGATNIGNYAFYKCNNLTSLTIPNSLISIGAEAFNGCSNLTSVTIPNSVTSIGVEVFYDCSSLTSVIIPSSVTNIGECAFANCSALTSIIVDSKNPVFDSRENCNAIIDTENNIFLVGCCKSFIPNSVTKLGDNAFRGCSSINSIIIPNSVTAIGKSVFLNCTNLTSINIPNSVVSIEDAAFDGCSNLSSVNLPNSVTNIGAYAFFGCSSIASVIIPNSVTSIKEGVFANCGSLSSLTIPNSVTSIGAGAFKYNSNLTSLTIPNSVNSIGESAFAYCSNLTSITIPNTVTSIEWGTFKGCSSLASVTIPNSVSTIGISAFEYCSSLTSVTIPNSVTNIENSAFSGCTCLISITIPKSVTYIGYNAFPSQGDISSITVEVGNSVYDSRNNCNALIETSTNTLILGCTNTIIPSSITSIGNGAFCGNQNLTKVRLPANVSFIDVSAFGGCKKIKDFYCYASEVPTISNLAFNGSSIGTATLHVPKSSLSKYQKANYWKDFGSIVGLSDSEMTVEANIDGINYKFDKATLQAEVIKSNPQYKGDIVIPATVNYEGLPFTVTTIGTAFYKCQELKSITLPETIGTIKAGAFTTGRIIKIIIPNLYFWLNLKIEGQLFGSYEGWEDGANITYYSSCNLVVDGKEVDDIFIPEGVEIIGNYAFSHCGINSVRIPKTVNTIGNYAFEGTRLYSIDIPNCVTTIGDYAFCETQLSSIDIPNSVFTIGRGAFLNCRNLSTANFGSGVRNIGENAFSGSSISSIELPEGMTIISKDAFANCSKLTAVKFPESVITIGYGAFRHSGLTELNLPSSLKEIQEEAFYGVPIEELVIPNSVTSIRRTAFHSCKKLAKLKLSESLSSISEYTFNGCESLTYVDIPNSVISIGIWAFSYSGLRSARLGNNINNISSAFLYCKNLEYIILTSDKIPSIQYTDRGIDNLSCQFIIPHNTYENGIPEEMTNFATYAKTPIYIKTQSVGATSAVLELQPVDSVYGYSEDQNSTIFTTKGLKPEAYIEWSMGDLNGGIACVKTKGLEIKVQEPKVLSKTKARLIATVEEVDDMEHFGFEWRRYTAPDDYPSYKVYAPLFNGQIVGTLNNLDPNEYYQYRPFYKSDSSELYYGDWMFVFTGDANVYFEPEVYTKDAEDITKVSALLAGVWFEGTDDFQEKGFEYWTVSSSKTRTVGSDVKKVTVSGNDMTATLEGLKAGATYGFRSYAKTASGTTYGEEKTFKTILIGDVNDDGELTDADVKAIASYILGKAPTVFNKKNADMNEDGKINAADIVELVRTISVNY